MVDIIVSIILILIIFGALFYIIRAKKRGEKCIGCPYSKQCSGNCHSNCNSSSDTEDK